jgi:uncharacterized protein (TIGR03435 family)
MSVSKCLIAVAFGGALAVLHAQTFDVASVKANHTDTFMRKYPQMHNGTFSSTGATLKSLLEIAYGVNTMRIAGPDWLDSDRFDISAKAPEGTADADIKPLLQALLAERLAVKAHFESRLTPVYEMTVAKGGPKLHLFDPANPPRSPENPGGSFTLGVGTTAQIADALARAAGRPIIDKAQLEGRFAFTVNFTPFSAAPKDNAPPDIFTAVQQQLGLKLEANREPIDILVVDHAERVPTEN